MNHPVEWWPWPLGRGTGSIMGGAAQGDGSDRSSGRRHPEALSDGLLVLEQPEEQRTQASVDGAVKHGHHGRSTVDPPGMRAIDRMRY